jgi:hypothetical protein
VTKGNGHRVASHASCQVGQSALYKRDEINNWLGQDTGRLFPLTLGSGLDSARELRRVQDTRYLRGLYRHCLPLGRGRSRCYPPSREIHRERERERESPEEATTRFRRTLAIRTRRFQSSRTSPGNIGSAGGWDLEQKLSSFLSGGTSGAQRGQDIKATRILVIPRLIIGIGNGTKGIDFIEIKIYGSCQLADTLGKGAADLWSIKEGGERGGG